MHNKKLFISYVNHLNFSVSYMSYILSWTTKKHLKNTFQATSFKVEENSRTFEGLAQKFKDFSRKNEIQVIFEEST